MADQVIVMGATGAGKSTFINQLLGTNKMTVGYTLKGCTREVSAAKIELPSGGSVDIVDTPGFNDGDPDWPDSKILTKIALWLAKTRRTNPVAAVIYIHDISQSGPVHELTLKIIKEICGKNGLSRLIIVTTKWGKSPGHEEDFEKAEELLKKKFFIPLFAGWKETNLVRMIRLESGNFEYSKNILGCIETLSENPIEELKIQKEMFTQKRPRIHETSAGKRAGFRKPSRWEEFLASLSELKLF